MEAACGVFAEKGFRDATIAEICQRAKANIAAVNYHFHDKETLYVEAWRLAFQRARQAHPPEGGVPAEAEAHVRLRGRIASRIRWILDPDNNEPEIVHKEMANPTGLLAEVMRESIEPLRQGLASIIRELLGPAASEQAVQWCQMSIRGQCFDMMARVRHGAGGGGGVRPSADEVEGIIDHVTRFSLAGIREVRRWVESGPEGQAAGRPAQ